MSTTITRVILQASVSKTAIFAGAGVDVSGITAQAATLVIHVTSFDAGQTARIQVTDTVDNFSSDIVAVYVAHIQGGLSVSDDRVIRIPWYNIPDARFGVASAKMKVSLTSISGGTIVYDVDVEY